MFNQYFLRMILVSVGVFSSGDLFATDSSTHKPTPKTITVSFHADSGDHREKILELVNDFNRQNPDLQISLLAYRGANRHKHELNKWLKQGHGPDVTWWIGGSRMRYYAEQGLLTDLTDFWRQSGNQQHFPQTLLDSVSYNDAIYGVPISSTLFGFYYSKTIFKKYNIKVPTNWAETLTACERFNERNITLFALGTLKTEWILHGWFDYINLRLNGLAFHQSLLEGKVSFKDSRVRNTLTHFKKLIDSQCFNADHHSFSIWDVFPTITRGLTAMALADSVPTHINFSDFSDIGFMTFPVINEDIPHYTVTPLSIFMVPHYAIMSTEIARVLNYMASEAFQSGFVEVTKHLPARIIKLPADSSRDNKIADVVKNSPGGIEYFDRYADINFASKTPAVFLDFVNNPDIDKAINKLEELRLKYLIKPAQD
ncbi:ABC transporter substrate-binding protein [Algibacillus agarilyticus]|uniref:ABC transporter substrate-binding protein n=1 Tax=Algibacillus agarilyticus TaxID=2234133 RepID=UPI000DD07E9F|nr:ABC transporter substrate-binding protein [Algibacillus agarilyticus]